MLKTYEIYISLFGHEAMMIIKTETREQAIKQGIQHLLHRHVLPNLKLHRANAKGKEIPVSSKSWTASSPLPPIKIIVGEISL